MMPEWAQDVENSDGRGIATKTILDKMWASAILWETTRGSQATDYTEYIPSKEKKLATLSSIIWLSFAHASRHDFQLKTIIRIER